MLFSILLKDFNNPSKNKTKNREKIKEHSFQKASQNNVPKKIIQILQKTCPGTPQDSKMGAQIAPRRPQMRAKIHQKSYFWASGTPLLQPTGPRDAQEGVNHPKWTQKSSKIDPKTMSRSLKMDPKIIKN